ncbi:hypothetical protein HEP86_26480 [Streptomyces sp. RPA4-5]|uniref:hypothetical protein n=1 Tax=Streptomyces TaxID=1883 RepID=UPI00143EC0E8|nr:MULTISPECIES: hypothetical protein [Streptomyces]MCX4636397.1 hypothetical protein [Streptomyces platensis]QIY57418.1 hypothetical protein HEP86_26480 [Streptomyces sp. RPA4-5]WJY40499.1 hypothetical protein QT196_26245 [Streptomyces sp. P9-2B-2]
MTTTAATTADTSTAATAERTPVVSFRQVSKSYGAVRAVCDLDLDVAILAGYLLVFTAGAAGLYRKDTHQA